METSLALCRLMHPGDANIAGNVHGGTILQMIEEAGLIVSTRHCNKGNTEENGPLATLARVERTDFLQPMYVGEISHLSAKVTYCSQHSLEVKVFVEAENLFSGVKRFTNKATLWYVPVKGDPVVVCKVPPMQYASQEEEKAGERRYLQQKKNRAAEKTSTSCFNDSWVTSVDIPIRNASPHTIANAQSTLIHLVGVQDCGIHGRVPGGVTMKLMDEVAGICAGRHCRTSVLTASMDAVDFHQPIRKGSLLHIRSRPIFTSQKSILIQVVVMVEEHKRKIDDQDPESGRRNIFCACTAFFTYVSFSPDRTTLPITPLQLMNEAETNRFKEGKLIYLKNKEARNSLS